MHVVGLIITDEVYARSFLNVNLLKELNSNKLVLFKARHLNFDEDYRCFFSKVIEIDFESQRKNKFILLALELQSWKSRKLSKTFSYKFRLRYPSFISLIKKRNFKSNNKSSIREYSSSSNKFDQANKSQNNFKSQFFGLSFVKLKIRKILIQIISLNIIFTMFIKLTGVFRILNNELMKHLKLNNVDLVLLPTGSMMAHDQIILNSCNQMSIKTYFLMDNWDNLSSKSVFLKRPDFISTWGPQSTLHAIEIHGFKFKEIFQLGSARFIDYSPDKTEPDESSDTYILFIGSVYRYKELDLLVKLDEEIEHNSDLKGKLKLIYRPYPGSERIIAMSAMNLKHTFLDSFTAEAYELELRTKFVGKLKVKLPIPGYYNELIRNSLFCIGGLSSMLLEASLFNKTYLAIATSEKNNLRSPATYLANFTHLEEIELLPNVKICNSIGSLIENFNQTINQKDLVDSNLIAANLSYFITTDTRKFGHRLANSINVVQAKQ